MRTHLIPSQALLIRLGLLLVLLTMQRGALLHAYSHFGIVPDPYATGDRHVPPAQGCDLGVVHAALEGDPLSCAPLLALEYLPPVTAVPAVTCFDRPSVLSFRSRAPPALT
jgi:hypothetical protein